MDEPKRTGWNNGNSKLIAAIVALIGITAAGVYQHGKAVAAIEALRVRAELIERGANEFRSQINADLKIINERLGRNNEELAALRLTFQGIRRPDAMQP